MDQKLLIIIVVILIISCVLAVLLLSNNKKGEPEKTNTNIDTNTNSNIGFLYNASISIPKSDISNPVTYNIPIGGIFKIPAKNGNGKIKLVQDGTNTTIDLDKINDFQIGPYDKPITFIIEQVI